MQTLRNRQVSPTDSHGAFGRTGETAVPLRAEFGMVDVVRCGVAQSGGRRPSEFPHAAHEPSKLILLTNVDRRRPQALVLPNRRAASLWWSAAVTWRGCW